MQFDDVVKKLGEVPNAQDVLAVLKDLDALTIPDELLPYPVPMAGPDFVQEVMTALSKRLSE